MRLVDFRDIVVERLQRQRQIKELQIHAHGHAAHVGKISYACGWCYAKKELFQLSCGDECMCRETCDYCFFGRQFGSGTPGPYRHNLVELLELSSHPLWHPDIVSYNSWGETLLAIQHGYADVFRRGAAIVKAIEEHHGVRIYKKLYTNGILADRDMLEFLKNEMDVTEIRFHLSASRFSDEVYRHMQMARDMGFIVVVEEPSLPAHREMLLEMLPRLQAIGVKHLDICEVEITQHNLQRLHELYPEGRMYRNLSYHLYDEGLAYDIIEEVIRKGYTFSVIDCSSDRERFARGRRDEALELEDVWDMYAQPPWLEEAAKSSGASAADAATGAAEARAKDA
jgi:hypothetical protein